MSEGESALIGAVDQGTGSSRFLVYVGYTVGNAVIQSGLVPYGITYVSNSISDIYLSEPQNTVFDSKNGDIIDYHQEEAHRTCPQEGWSEMDPMWILESVRRCIEEVIKKLKTKAVNLSRIKCIGITNQMLTFIPWDRTTGRPLHNAIVWSDVRTHSEVEAALERIPNRNKDYFRERTGLPVTAIFFYTKIPWLIKNIPEVRKAIEEKRCCIGTVDTWLLWNLTGGPNGGKYLTDITNVSATGLLNLHTMKWDTEVAKFFDIPIDLFAEIRSTSEIYGHVSSGPLTGLPISGIIGDQTSAITGHLCFKPGKSKCTYGTIACININTGLKPITSTQGLMTMPQYQLGPQAKPIYSMMGPIPGCGELIVWMKDNLKMIDKPSDIEKYASNVDSTHDCFFVPAFEGLFCPYWESDARGTIVGMTAYTTRDHICRAALESICFQVKDVLAAMITDTGFSIPELVVDGGMTANNFIMQIQADFLGRPIVRPALKEATAFGAALMAGAASGIDIFKVSENKQEVVVNFDTMTEIFRPKMTSEDREKRSRRWQKAIEKAKHWLSD